MCMFTYLFIYLFVVYIHIRCYVFVAVYVHVRCYVFVVMYMSVAMCLFVVYVHVRCYVFVVVYVHVRCYVFVVVYVHVRWYAASPSHDGHTLSTSQSGTDPSGDALPRQPQGQALRSNTSHVIKHKSHDQTQVT